MERGWMDAVIPPENPAPPLPASARRYRRGDLVTFGGRPFVVDEVSLTDGVERPYLIADPGDPTACHVVAEQQLGPA
jgi:hypothetical protein